MWTVPRLCEFYPGICLTTEEKARKNLSQGKKKPQLLLWKIFESPFALRIYPLHSLIFNYLLKHYTLPNP